jgi:hypothetical protein
MKWLGRKKYWLVSLLLIGVAGVSLYLFLPERPDDMLEVPLGVEEAVIVTYNGNPIEAIPYKWGVALNVRIADVQESGGQRVYDIRYIVNRAGEYDLKDYFRDTNGNPSEGFPSFRVRGSSELSKDIEERIAETENVKVAIRAWYYETLIALGIIWVAWLALLVWWPKKKAAAAPAVVRPSTLADDIRRYLAMLESGSLDTAHQAKLELMIFRQWRDQQSLGDVPMSDLLLRFRSDPEVSAAYTELENWLHRTDRTGTARPVADAVRARIKSASMEQTMETAAP